MRYEPQLKYYLSHYWEETLRLKISSQSWTTCWPGLARYVIISISDILPSSESYLMDSTSCPLQVNEDMAGFSVGVGSGQSAAIHHTLQRHTEILQVLYCNVTWTLLV